MERLDIFRQEYQTQGISLVALDVRAPFVMAQIVHKIIGSYKTRKSLFSLEIIAAMAPSLYSPENKTPSWWTVLVEQFRPFFPQEPAFSSHVASSDKDKTAFETITFVLGDPTLTMNFKESECKD